ncbi:MAG TPA: GAF domain-containing protein [Methylomirabilota bacterium]|nr:GAF domain-containing protein [Methylomirabilota bacterium]
MLLVSADDAVRNRIVRMASDYSIFSALTDDEALDTLRLTTVDLIVKDVAPPARDLPAFLATSRQRCPGVVIICLSNADEQGGAHLNELLQGADFLVKKPLVNDELGRAFRQAQEKQQLLLEVSTSRDAGPRAGQTGMPFSDYPEPSSQMLEQVVKEFAKALSANFDLQRVLELFLDAVGELVKPSRAALLLLDPEKKEYRIVAHRGLTPRVAESLRFLPDQGLPLWLLTQGRMLRVEELANRSHDPSAREIQRELATLQGVLAIPLMAHGGLSGLLTLGQRITGGSYSPWEGEILFNLASHLAIAIQDISLHHEIHYQKTFIEKILSHMSNGVITIGPDEKVVLFNHRAGEILSLSPGEVLGKDLRALPSPLGDMLYETLKKARQTQRTEIQLALGKLALELSTYPIIGESGDALGAVLVFEDLTRQKQLWAQKRQAEQFQLLSRTIASIADEIKNPLVSIHTFMDLLPDRYDDMEFRHQFSAVVGRDMRRLVQLFEKLAALVSEGTLTIEVVDVRSVVEECLKGLNAHVVPSPPEAESTRLMSLIDEEGSRAIQLALYFQAESLAALGDRAQLVKALSYLIWYQMRKCPNDGTLALSVSRHRVKTADQERVQIVLGARKATMTDAELQRLFDPLAVVQESLIDVGPSVSQRIIEAQGGHVEVKRGKDEVSFVVSLPAPPRGGPHHA